MIQTISYLEISIIIKVTFIKLRNDFYRTKEYYEYALDFLKRNGYQNTTNFSHIFSNYIKSAYLS